MFSKKAFKNYQKSNNFKFISIVSFLFLVYFFLNSFIYAQPIEKNETNYLVPMGNILQIDAELETIIVRNNVENSPFQVGDSVLKIGQTPIHSYGDFSKLLCSLENNKQIEVLINRGGQQVTFNTTKDILEKINFNNLLSGFATLTYINPETSEFGAVGHPINIGTSKKIPIKHGSIATTTDLNIQKSCRGSVGCINAKRNDTVGQFNENTSFGIKGTISNIDFSSLKKYKVASLNEVKLGKAKILLQTDDLKSNEYDIEIIYIEKQKHPDSKTFKIKIVDKDLLIKTGGIVQGMSGTPIIQDDKIVGAVSHAVENDPTLGYGVFIQWMLEDN